MTITMMLIIVYLICGIATLVWQIRMEHHKPKNYKICPGEEEYQRSHGWHTYSFKEKATDILIILLSAIVLIVFWWAWIILTHLLNNPRQGGP